MDRVDLDVLKKLIVAILACLTIFLSKRALTDPHASHASVQDPRARSNSSDGALERDTSASTKPARTAVLF